MSGNARGQLKEELEGIVRNIVWIQKHSEAAIVIIGDTHPELIAMFQGLHATMGALADELNGVYATL